VNDHTLKVVKEFKYLGSTEDDDATIDTEIKHRINAMKRTFYMDYALIYRRRSITLRARMQMFLAKVTAVAVYGCAAWNYSHHHLAKLESTYFQLLKRLIRIKKPWHAITYEDIINAGKKRGLRIQPLQLYIHFYKARYLGHLARTKKSALQRKIIHSEVKSHTQTARKRANRRVYKL
jgi:hypothetical protein